MVLFVLLYQAVSSSDRNAIEWRNAIEFWSNVTCSMKDIKTVNVHNVLESESKSSIFFEQYFQGFVQGVAHKCARTISISRIYTLCNKENPTSFVGNDEVIDRSVKRPPIWNITSDYISSRVMPLTVGNIPTRKDKTFDSLDTWNMHVILTRDIHSFDQISRDDTRFEWNSHDRFIVLIARFPERHGPSNESNSRIDDILKTLWSKHKVQKIFVSEGIFYINDTIQINRIVRTYNPFAKVNDSGS